MPKNPAPVSAPRESAVVHAPPTGDQRAEALREAYKKHATELLDLEDSQQKVTLLFLGIFGAGASFLASSEDPLDRGANPGLTLAVVAILALAALYTYDRNKARKAVRGLIVACEEAMGFFETGVYLKNHPLYPTAYLNYPKAGAWLSWASFATVVLSAAGFLLVAWYR
jgi:hypothetical protein